jgi:hypothetical protein
MSVLATAARYAARNASVPGFSWIAQPCAPARGHRSAPCRADHDTGECASARFSCCCGLIPGVGFLILIGERIERGVKLAAIPDHPGANPERSGHPAIANHGIEQRGPHADVFGRGLTIEPPGLDEVGREAPRAEPQRNWRARPLIGSARAVLAIAAVLGEDRSGMPGATSTGLPKEPPGAAPGSHRGEPGGAKGGPRWPLARRCRVEAQLRRSGCLPVGLW